MLELPSLQGDSGKEKQTGCAAASEAGPKNVILGSTGPGEPNWTRAHLAELPLNRCSTLLSLSKPFTGKTYSRKRRQDKWVHLLSQMDLLGLYTELSLCLQTSAHLGQMHV
jgi:hypothetical protein